MLTYVLTEWHLNFSLEPGISSFQPIYQNVIGWKYGNFKCTIFLSWPLQSMLLLLFLLLKSSIGSNQKESIHSSSICLLNKCLLSAYCMPSNLLSLGIQHWIRLFLLPLSSHSINYQVPSHSLYFLSNCLPLHVSKALVHVLIFLNLGHCLGIQTGLPPCSVLL